ncbi:MAG: MCE family protein [Candidatus Cloacimonetes bacterium]|nr:MCE family protein [Candidatus Cloacimonadota bacterium]
MVSKTQKLRLGVFIVIISALMLFFIIMVAGKSLMEKRDYYHIIYKDVSVSGLQIGGTVKYYGINIGRVEDISIDTKDVRNVIVAISIKRGTPVKEDVEASLIPVGITGLLQVELRGGSNEARTLLPGSEINAGTSTFESITSKAEVLSNKIEILLNNLAEITSAENREKINNILGNVDGILDENKESVNNILTNMDSISFHLASLTRSSSEAVERLNQIVQSEQMQNILDNSEKFSSDLAETDIKKLLKDVNKAVNQVNDTFAHLDLTHLKTRQDIIQTIETLRETMDYLNEFSRQISEEPSMLIRTKRK